MTDESIPSGALKVAELVAEVRYHLDHGLGNMRVFAKACKALNELAALASPSPATGALSEDTIYDLHREMLRSDHRKANIVTFARAVEAAHGITKANHD